MERKRRRCRDGKGKGKKANNFWGLSARDFGPNLPTQLAAPLTPQSKDPPRTPRAHGKHLPSLCELVSTYYQRYFCGSSKGN